VRLALVSVPASLVRDLAARRKASTERRLRVRLPEDFELRAHVRLRPIYQDPQARPWLFRFIVLREPVSAVAGGGRSARTAVGLIGFHGPPDEHRRAEVGYEVFAPYRRQGYAREAVSGLLDWAARRQGVRTFLATIATDNEPSMRLALGLGFRQVGAQVDEEGSVDFIYELTMTPDGRHGRTTVTLAWEPQSSQSPGARS
jgi:RimJ/RimL family protein N-acetyltransferase